MPYYGVVGSTAALRLGSTAWLAITRAQQIETLLAQVCDGDITVEEAGRSYWALATDSASFLSATK